MLMKNLNSSAGFGNVNMWDQKKYLYQALGLCLFQTHSETNKVFYNQDMKGCCKVGRGNVIN